MNVARNLPQPRKKDQQCQRDCKHSQTLVDKRTGPLSCKSLQFQTFHREFTRKKEEKNVDYETNGSRNDSAELVHVLYHSESGLETEHNSDQKRNYADYQSQIQIRYCLKFLGLLRITNRFYIWPNTKMIFSKIKIDF